jgi:hypothetical protein
MLRNLPCTLALPPSELPVMYSLARSSADFASLPKVWIEVVVALERRVSGRVRKRRRLFSPHAKLPTASSFRQRLGHDFTCVQIDARLYARAYICVTHIHISNTPRLRERDGDLEREVPRRGGLALRRVACEERPGRLERLVALPLGDLLLPSSRTTHAPAARSRYALTCGVGERSFPGLPAGEQRRHRPPPRVSSSQNYTWLAHGAGEPRRPRWSDGARGGRRWRGGNAAPQRAKKKVTSV